MDKKILTIQDISCVGQCSLTVALPIVSACGMECAVLPTAVLSTHTGGFKGYTFLDLTDEMGKIASHWKKENFSFDCIYTGYIGSTRQIEVIKSIFDEFGRQGIIVVDPVMADKGKLYPGFDMAFVKEMAGLIGKADIIVPNITEACFLLGEEYKEQYDKAYIEKICGGFSKLTKARVVLTGVSFEQNKLGVAVTDGRGGIEYYFHEKIAVAMHGTGDVYASSLVGALLRGKDLPASASIAADYTVECIKQTMDDASHWYGVKFEKALPYLIKRING